MNMIKLSELTPEYLNEHQNIMLVVGNDPDESAYPKELLSHPSVITMNVRPAEGFYTPATYTDVYLNTEIPAIRLPVLDTPEKLFLFVLAPFMNYNKYGIHDIIIGPTIRAMFNDCPNAYFMDGEDAQTAGFIV